jgi:serine/threonine-protein kinase
VAPAAGIQFGNYRLIERLAHGGMAEVFLARQQGPEGFDRRVAIKRILPHLADAEDFLRMFLAEARLAASLSHPNVVHIYELGKVGDHYFLAMEYIDGVHAGAMIERGARERLPVALVARIGADACAGLNYVHNAVDSSGRPLHLVHRDISPPNLMVSYDGVVKLMDFGIAKAAGQVEQTRPGIVKGKFAYMSPEQTTGETLDGRSDVFSLALVMWELLAGRVALPRTDPVEAMTMIRDGKIPPLRAARPDVPPALADVLEQGLQVDREHRPSAADLGNALEGFIKSSPELGTAMQLSEWVRRRFPRRASPGEAAARGQGIHSDDASTDIAPGLGYDADTNVGTDPALAHALAEALNDPDTLPPISGETISPGHYAPPSRDEHYPDTTSDEASAPATTPAATSLPRRMSQNGRSGPVVLDPATAFLDTEDDDEDATIVSAPPRPDTVEPTPAPSTASTLTARAALRAHERNQLAETQRVPASPRSRRAMRILAAAILAALAIGLFLWVLSTRTAGAMGQQPGTAPSGVSGARQHVTVTPDASMVAPRASAPHRRALA